MLNKLLTKSTFRARLARAALSICLLVLLENCGSNSHPPVSETKILMGTYISITCYDNTLPEKQIRTAMDSAFRAIANVEARTNPYDTSSVIGHLNRKKGNSPEFLADKKLRSLITSAAQIASETKGDFDFTLWPVFRLWHFDTDSAAVPPADKIQGAIQFVNYQNVDLDSNRIIIEPQTEIDLGGISKGFAVEEARKALKSQGLRNFIIDAGGNLGIEWRKDQPVEVNARHPRKEGEFWGQFPVGQSCGIATSGDYHFYFMKNGVRYHHILNPKTGYPAREAVSVTIIAPNAILADGYSTAIFVMGHKRGSRFIESHPDLEGLIIYKTQRDTLATYLSPALTSKFTRSPNEKNLP